MKLKNHLINLMIIGAGLILVQPAQAETDQDRYIKDSWGGLMKVKNRGDERRYRDDDDDDRRDRGKYDVVDENAEYMNSRRPNQVLIPRNNMPNFKERLNIQREKRREEARKRNAESEQNQ